MLLSFEFNQHLSLKTFTQKDFLPGLPYMTNFSVRVKDIIFTDDVPAILFHKRVGAFRVMVNALMVHELYFIFLPLKVFWIVIKQFYLVSSEYFFRCYILHLSCGKLQMGLCMLFFFFFQPWLSSGVCPTDLCSSSRDTTGKDIDCFSDMCIFILMVRGTV